MATPGSDLSSLRIDRSTGQLPQKRRSRSRIVIWTIAVLVLVTVALAIKHWLDPGIQVQLATATLTSPSQADAVLTASGYVVARRKAAVASKGTGTLVYLAVEEGDRVKRGKSLRAWMIRTSWPH